MRAVTAPLDGAGPEQSAGRPVLFLDIDDVLCLSDPYGGFDVIALLKGLPVHNPETVYRELFAPKAVRALERLHEFMASGVRYVISSTWRESFSREQLAMVLRRAGLAFVADNLAEEDRWRTPPKFGRSQRVDEIAQWLDAHHDGAPIAILDDTHSGWSLMPATHTSDAAAHRFAGRVVLCQEGVGLTDAHVAPLFGALQREVTVSQGGYALAVDQKESR